MPASDLPKSFDATGADEPSRLEEIRRSPAFRYLAVAICGVGLATAGSTIIRLSQGWRQPPAASAPHAPGPVPGPAPAQPAPPPPAPTMPDLTEMRVPAETPNLAEPGPATAPATEPEIKLTEKQASPPPSAPGPIASEGEPGAPGQAAAGIPPEPVQTAETVKASPPEGPTPVPAPLPAPPAELASPFSPPSTPDTVANAPAAAAAPEIAQAPETVPPAAPPASPAPTAPARSIEPNRSVGPSKQGVETPAREKRPVQPRRSRYAAPARAEPSGHLREIAAPAGTAPGVRAYSFAANGGRMTGAYGAPVQIIRVR